MKVRDYERAIDALCVHGLVIDEIKMQGDEGGQVRQVYGHTDTLTVLWDESGRAFTAPANQECEDFIEFGSGKIVTGRRLERSTGFDLKFE